jgi:PAN domain
MGSILTPKNSGCPAGSSYSIPNNDLQVPFATYCGYDLPGDDSARLHADSFESCAGSCVNAHPRCYAFAWEGSELHGFDNCYLKNAVGTPTLQQFSVDAAIVYGDSILISDANCASLPPLYVVNSYVFRVSCGLNIPGYDLYQIPADDMTDCIDQCSIQHECEGVAYEADRRYGYLNCYLKNFNA